MIKFHERLTVREACKGSLQGEHTHREIERGKRLAVHREAYKGKENEMKMKMKILKKKRQKEDKTTHRPQKNLRVRAPQKWSLPE